MLFLLGEESELEKEGVDSAAVSTSLKEFFQGHVFKGPMILVR